MKDIYIKKLTIAGLCTALAVSGSFLSFPLFGAKCAPVQHVVNVVLAVVLGPWWALGSAFLASLIRNFLGLGTLFAFPGSMCGAMSAGFLYRKGKRLEWAVTGEVIGTALIGGMLAYPIAKLIMHNDKATLFTFVIPFLISTGIGAIAGYFVSMSLLKMGLLYER